MTPPQKQKVDTRVVVETPEGADFQFVIAGAGPRAMAWLLDRLIQFGIIAVISILAMFLLPFGEAGAGLVKARATAKGDVTGLDIDPSILVASEKEVVEDLILAAIHDAQAKAKARNEQEMTKLGESLGLPPGMKLPG